MTELPKYEVDAMAIIRKLEAKLGQAYTAIAILEAKVEELMSEQTPPNKSEVI